MRFLDQNSRGEADCFDSLFVVSVTTAYSLSGCVSLWGQPLRHSVFHRGREPIERIIRSARSGRGWLRRGRGVVSQNYEKRRSALTFPIRPTLRPSRW